MKPEPSNATPEKVLLLLGIILLAVFFGFLRPMEKEADDLSHSLSARYAAISTNLNVARFVQAGTTVDGDTNLYQAKQSIKRGVEFVAKQTRLPDGIRKKFEIDFELLSFQVAQVGLAARLSGLAKREGVALDSAVLGGLPKYREENPFPTVLWVHQFFAEGLVTKAVLAGVDAVHTVSVAADGASNGEVNLTLEVTAGAAVVKRFLDSLPVRLPPPDGDGASEELPALFIDRLVMLKEPPKIPDHVRLRLGALGRFKPPTDGQLPLTAASFQETRQ